MTNLDIYHLKVDESNPRKRTMLCGINDSMIKWNTLNYINWHVAVNDRCEPCMDESEYICINCNHWALNHKRGICQNKNCQCTAL